MIRITVAGDQAQRLRMGEQSLEVVDEQGNVVGCYWQAFTNAEILEAKRRAATEPTGRTTAQILHDLSAVDSE